MKKRSSNREVTGWKYPPSAWYPKIGLDHVLRGGKDLDEYIKNDLKAQQAAPMKRKTGKIKKKKVNGKWVAIN